MKTTGLSKNDAAPAKTIGWRPIVNNFDCARLTLAIVVLLATGVTGLFAGTAAFATTYYVGTGGSDTASGQTEAEAFHSFARAMSALKPGDRLVVESGHYDEPLNVTVSGTADAPIEITGGKGSLPQLRDEAGAVVVNADYVRLSRLDAASIGDDGNAILVEPGHHHVTISDTVAHDSGCSGIGGLQTDYLTIRHNRVYGNAKRSPWQCSGISIYQAANVDDRPGFHNVISGNIVTGNMNLVPDPKLPPRSQGKTTDGNGIILDDFHHEQVWRGRKTAPYTATSLVENNVAIGNGGRGIEVSQSDGVTIRNNTVFHDLKDTHLLGDEFGEIRVIFAKDVRIFNNIMVPGDSATYGLLAYEARSIVADHNLVVGGRHPGYRAKAASLDWAAHNLIGTEAGFVDAGEKPDLHLTARSPAVGQGAGDQAPRNDLDGKSRPVSGAVDLGAYQLDH